MRALLDEPKPTGPEDVQARGGQLGGGLECTDPVMAGAGHASKWGFWLGAWQSPLAARLGTRSRAHEVTHPLVLRH